MSKLNPKAQPFTLNPTAKPFVPSIPGGPAPVTAPATSVAPAPAPLVNLPLNSAPVPAVSPPVSTPPIMAKPPVNTPVATAVNSHPLTNHAPLTNVAAQPAPVVSAPANTPPLSATTLPVSAPVNPVAPAAAAAAGAAAAAAASPAASPAAVTANGIGSAAAGAIPKLRATAPVFVPGVLKPSTPSAPASAAASAATPGTSSSPAISSAVPPTVNSSKGGDAESAAANVAAPVPSAGAARKEDEEKEREQREKEEREQRDREERERREREEKERIEREENERKAREERERKEKEEKEKREREEKERKEKEEKERRAQTFLPKGLPNLNLKKPTITLAKNAAAERMRQPKSDAADEHADVPDTAITRDIAEKTEETEAKPKDKDREEKNVAAASAAKDKEKEASNQDKSTGSTTPADHAVSSAQYDILLKLYSKEWLLSVRHSSNNCALAKRLEEVRSLLDSLKLLESGSYEGQARRGNQGNQSNGPNGSGKDWERGSKLAPERGKSSSSSRPFDSSNQHQHQHRAGKDHSYSNQRRDKSDHDRNRKGQGGARKDEPLLKDSEVKPLAMSENRYQVMKQIPIDVKLVRDITFILNRVTKDNFDLMLERAKELSGSIDKPSALRDIVHAFFEKALDEPIFAPIYAEFALKLGAHLPSFAADDDDSQNSENFRRLLLNRCQAEFEDVEQAVDPEKLATMTKEEKEEFDGKQKRRQLGAIRFIGELYARGMLNSTVIKDCIIQLLGDLNTPDEVDIEALNKLLETVGKKFDAKQNQTFLDELFKSLDAIRNGGKVSSRIKFMIQNTAELRQRQWIQRTQKEEPKKIAEIHKAEKAVKSKAASNTTAQRIAASAVSVTRPAMKKDRYALMIDKPKAKKEEKREDDGFVQVKSSRKTPTMQRMKSANTSTPKNGKSESAKKGDDGDEHHVNAFSALGDEDEEHDEQEQEHDEALDDGEEEEEQQDEDDGAGARAVGSSSGGSASVTEGVDDLEDDGAELDERRVKELSEEYVKKYFSCEDEKAVSQLIRLNLAEKGARMPIFIKAAIRECLDRKERELELLPKLLKFLSDDGSILPEDVEDGLEEIFSRLDDYLNDNPKAPEYVGTVLGNLSALDVYSLRIMATSSKVKNLEDELKFSLTAAAASAYRLKKGEAAMVDAWKKAQLSAEFLGTNTTKAREFANKKGLEAIAAIL